MKQKVIVELSQSVPHLLRHWTLLILWIMLKVGQQKNLEEEQSKKLHQDILINIWGFSESFAVQNVFF